MSLLLDVSKTKVLNISIKHGDTFDPSLTFTDNCNKPVDLMGTSILMQVRRTSATGAVVLTFTNEVDGGITISANTLLFNKNITLNAATYFYDLKITYTTGKIKTVIGGTFSVIQNVSNL